MNVLKPACVAGAVAAAAALLAVQPPAHAQTAHRDGIQDLLRRVAATGTETGVASPEQPKASPAAQDPRAGDPAYEQARRLMSAVDAILKETAAQRTEARKLPGNDDFIVTPLWTETREDREDKIRNLLDSALGIVTDVPVVEVQKKIEGLRRDIRQTQDNIVSLKEKQLTAPKDSLLPGMLTDTVASLQSDIETSEKRIADANEEIATSKVEIHKALQTAGIKLEKDQVDLLLDSVLSGDLVRLVATFNAAKLIDAQLAKMMSAAGENINASRKYFAMHAALFAMLVHAQNSTIEKIDTFYLPRLEAILKDIRKAKERTRRLLRANNRPDQRRALNANKESQALAEQAAKGYKRYLRQQREQIANARRRATHDLNIADNTFETVEASFQLRQMMRDSAASFEAIQKLEAPTFDQIFKNEELRREFENLTRKLDV
ncbi:MAG: hypothetical protein K0U34_05280, partial [Alphaproteobacteria bacterium]|nr:hypothetical protein [Alphaproteobacteria bacterium]